MAMSETIAALASALSKAQGAFRNVTKGNKNAFLEYRYASLDDVIEATRKPLADNGLAIIQAPGKFENGQLLIGTILLHESGEFFGSEMTIPVSIKKGLSDAQTVGVAITYARRYALMAMLGIAAEGDDQDGHVAVADGRHTSEAQRPAAARQQQSGDTKPATSSEVGDAVQHYKDTLLTTRTARDVDDCVGSLLAILPGFNESKHWPRVIELASNRKDILAARPPMQPRPDDLPDQDHNKVVNHPEAGPDPEETPHDPETGEVLDEAEAPPNTAALLIMIESFRDAIRGKRSLKAIEGFADTVLKPFAEEHGHRFDKACLERWEDITSFYETRAGVLSQNGAK